MKRITSTVMLIASAAAVAACGSSSSTSSSAASSGGAASSTASGPPPKVCVMAEFKSRADGIPGLQATYGDVWGSYPVTIVDKTAEKEIASGQCDAGEVFTTDSGIAANSLTVLQDDKTLFPPDNIGLIVRSQVLKAHPGIAAIVDPIAATITTDVITKLNKMVEIDGQKPADVAKAYLQQIGASATASATGGGGTSSCPAPGSSLDGGGASVSIGSKSFAEEEILAEIARQALTAHNFSVTYTTQEADPQIGQDLSAGKIDMYWQYTGTELQKYDNVDSPMRDLHAAFQQAKGLDDAKGLCWVGEAPMDDTNGLAIRSTDTGKFGSTLSAFTAYLQAHPGS
ncbi:MAG TPA: glycine betaine ABC transporter substrate-binding protein [Candidatus Dormibacteraeota bacterium]|nr:glycine betaine ABC transporter substrate-binding protein [Candidatus Dormibacteraeota bacterium]